MTNQCKKALRQTDTCPQRHQVLVPETCKCHLKRESFCRCDYGSLEEERDYPGSMRLTQHAITCIPTRR